MVGASRPMYNFVKSTEATLTFRAKGLCLEISSVDMQNICALKLLNTKATTAKSA